MWLPKWNSGQGVNKSLESEAHQGGYPIFHYCKDDPLEELNDHTPVSQQSIAIDVNHHIYANQELTEFTQALKQLTPEPLANINANLAQQLGLKPGDQIHLIGRQGNCSLPCNITKVANNLVTIPWQTYLQLGEQINLCSTAHPNQSTGGNDE